MRLSRYAFSALLLFFASAFVAAVLPSVALAATIDVTQGMEVMYIRDFDVRMADVTLSQAREGASKRMQHVVLGNGSITYTEDNDGYSTGTNYSGAVRTTANGYPYVSSFVRDTAYDYIYIDTSGTGSISNQASDAWVATGMASVDAFEANTAVGLMMIWAKDVMPANSGFYVMMPYVNMVMRVGNSSLNCAMNGMRVFAGTATNNLVECEYDSTSGMWTCTKAIKQIFIVFNASNRSVSNLYQTHDYYIYGKPSVYAMLSDVNIVNLQNNIETNVEDQTQQLMDTSGSDSIVDSDQMNDNVDNIESIGLFESVAGIADQLHQALNTTEEDSGVVFPGLNLMGFQIASATIDVWDYSPIPQNTVRGFVTFTFVIWYIRYMIALIDDIFGLKSFSVPAYEEGVYDVGHWQDASTFSENHYGGGVYKI